MTRQATSSGFPLVRGVQLTKELAVLNWEIQAAQNQLDKSWFDAFLTNAGINAGSSSGYSYRGASNYDVIVNPGGTKESQTTKSGLAAELISNVAPTERGAGHVFTAASSYALASVTFNLLRLGSPTGNVRAALYAVSGGLPTGAALATSANLNVATISTSQTDYVFSFTSPYSVVSGTDYAVVLETNGAYTGDGSNHVNIYGNGSGAADIRKSNADVWTTGMNSVYFINSETAASTALVKSITVTMPSAITSVIAFVDTGAATPDLVRFSTDGGSTWTTIPTASIGKIVGVPSGTSCILEVTFTGATELEAWGFAGA